MTADPYDVAVVGASIAGCTAARLFAQRGARVALIERRPDPDAYKTVCTHYVQSSATPTIRRLGLADALESRGAIHNAIEIWTRHGGWIRPQPEEGVFGYSITRRAMDPILRRLAADTPGVELMAGWTVTGLLGDGRPQGVEIEDTSCERRRIESRLLVAADGRGSGLARLAGVPGRVKPNRRFFYWSYWTGMRPDGTNSRMWLLEPDCAYTFPMEEGLCLALVAPHEDRLPDFRADREGAYMRMLRSLPDGPDLSGATRESKLLGKLDLPNMFRPAAVPGLAFVGDAAMCGDPFWGIGCGWAFQSSEWLVEETAPALLDGGDLDAALERYRRAHRRRLLPHHMQMSDFAGGRPSNPVERLFWRGAAGDPQVARLLDEVGSRRASPAKALRSPGLMLRALRA